MKRTIPLVGLLALACSSLNVQPPTRQVTPVAERLPMTTEAAWRRSLDALSALGFTIGTSDRVGGLLTTAEKQVSEALPIDGHDQVYYFDCGRVLGQPAARGTDVYATVQLRLESAGADSTALHLTVLSRGHNAEVARMGNSSNLVDRTAAGSADMRCVSMGTLETAIMARIRAR